MQKEDLIGYIMQKSQKCLDETDEQDHLEAYFFSKIMELFCRRYVVSVIAGYAY